MDEFPDFQDDFIDNVDSQEFQDFVGTVVELTLHMVLSEPAIALNLVPWKQR